MNTEEGTTKHTEHTKEEPEANEIYQPDIEELDAVGMGPYCPKCHTPTDWLRCWNCGGEGGHDGYDEDPLWYDEGDVIPCGECHGKGGWWRCWDCGQCFEHLGDGPNQEGGEG